MKLSEFIKNYCLLSHKIYAEDVTKVSDGVRESKFAGYNIMSIEVNAISNNTLSIRCDIKQALSKDTAIDIEDIKQSGFKELYRYVKYMATHAKIDETLILQCQIYSIDTSTSIYKDYEIPAEPLALADRLTEKYFGETNLITGIKFKSCVYLLQDAGPGYLQSLGFNEIIFRGTPIKHGRNESFLHTYRFEFYTRKHHENNWGQYCEDYYIRANEIASIERLSNGFKIVISDIQLELVYLDKYSSHGRAILDIAKWFDLK